MRLYTKRNQFEDSLDLILESEDIFADATGKLGEVNIAQQGLAGLQAELREDLEQIHGRLATEIRRQNHDLDVWLDRTGKVRVKYGSHTRSLCLKADAHTKSWVMGDTPFERQFAKYNHNALEADQTNLAKAISTYFKDNYKAMQPR